MVMTKDGAATLTERVFTQIRADILAGRHEPGAPIRLSAVARQCDVSTAVVREALIRLAERHLLVLTPNQGYRVVEVSREDLIDLTEIRIMLEAQALRRSIELGDVDWEATVVSTHHVLDRTPLMNADGVGTTEEWAVAHEAFHAALGSACASPRLMMLTGMLRDSGELYRQLSLKAKAEAGRDVAAEHRQLMELSTAREADAAVAALTAHVQRTADLVLDQVLVETVEQT